MLDEPARQPVVPRAGGATAETTLASSTAQANVPDTRSARTVTELGGNGGGFPGWRPGSALERPRARAGVLGPEGLGLWGAKACACVIP